MCGLHRPTLQSCPTQNLRGCGLDVCRKDRRLSPIDREELASFDSDRLVGSPRRQPLRPQDRLRREGGTPSQRTQALLAPQHGLRGHHALVGYWALALCSKSLSWARAKLRTRFQPPHCAASLRAALAAPTHELSCRRQGARRPNRLGRRLRRRLCRNLLRCRKLPARNHRLCPQQPPRWQKDFLLASATPTLFCCCQIGCLPPSPARSFAGEGAAFRAKALETVCLSLPHPHFHSPRLLPRDYRPAVLPNKRRKHQPANAGTPSAVSAESCCHHQRRLDPRLGRARRP